MPTKTKMIADGRFGALDLKSIKTLSNGSFEANVYVNGKMVGYVCDSGRGGCYDWGVSGDDWKAVQAECEKYREWCQNNGHKSDYYEWEDCVIGDLLEWKDDQKFAKKAKRDGSLFAVKVTQSDESREDGVWGMPVSYAGSIEGDPETVAVELTRLLVEDNADVCDGAHDQIEVLMADGEVFDAPVVVPADLTGGSL